MDELYDLNKEDLRLMRDYLDDLSGVNSGDMERSARGRSETPDRRDLLRTIMNSTNNQVNQLRFDTKKAWEKVSARIGRDER